MADLKQIKEKMNIFLKEIENINTPDEAIERFKKIFDGEYYETFTDVDEPYYECHSQQLYLYNGYGIGIEKTWGPFDFFGSEVSHEGEDLCIFSKLANDVKILFECSEKKEILNNIDSLYNIDLSTKNLLSVDDELIFNFIPENELENTNEMIIGRYENLKRKAELDHENDVNNDLISYYGGLDVTINSTEYYLYNSLLENRYNTEFMKIAIPLFIKDFPEYFNDEIEECNQALYIIENKEKYNELIKLEENELNTEGNKINIEKLIKETENKKIELQKKLDGTIDELKDLKTKKYSVVDFFKGSKKIDAIKINNIEQNVLLLKNQISTKEIELNQEIQNYNYLRNKEKTNDEQKDNLKKELKYPFKDFTLNPDFEEEPYINGEYFLKVSLDRLINKEDYYKQKLQELQFMKSYDTNEKQIEIAKEVLEIEC